MLTLLQISSTRVFLKTLLTTTDCLITSPKTSITHLFFGFFFFFIKKYKSTFDNKPAKTNGLHKENKNLQSCVLLSTFPCSGHLLYFCPWYLSDSLKGKKTKYFTVHHWCTSEYTISGTDEEDASMLNQEDSHTHMRAKFLAHEGNQNVEIPRASNPIQHTFKPRVCVLCA